ncbi:MAG: hypothetical protein KA765_09325 [Thermoflexales bacterium]|nr:hypothetical protein [Thermoflexales bacterium]
MNTRHRKLYWLGLSLILLISLAGCASAATPAPTASMNNANSGTGMDMKAPAAVPAGRAYAEGQEIFFMHTEVSDEGVAKILTDMMSSPVLVVPSLAKASDEMLANVYVFKNGLKGMGPLGFQPDVFDNPPGTAGYRPLRRLILVTWQDAQAARELKSLAEVQAALDKGELTAEQPGVVINMPFVTWPGGKR